ncbi:hypothetical protein Mp_1g02400 [Marchantia polymorpha subsp. ruderalis]|uniref:Uncharacterized protein n=2 Tax=Marchantia polymorpha TaxID=3197 RepID=A0AAF6AKQ1_MARPO|nr:hypothetical protein MARPO_0029s0007 [Marchantia polymorpha]BBM97021.1 hypothetical protein Mp_1g02400 [Marchantia polymorpha subsp. ruderalis]|eukprot:PTQ42460.1 hypothetical protein MARPO_0029s0007 [Marchantia polymorpha]
MLLFYRPFDSNKCEIFPPIGRLFFVSVSYDVRHYCGFTPAVRVNEIIDCGRLAGACLIRHLSINLLPCLMEYIPLKFFEVASWTRIVQSTI